MRSLHIPLTSRACARAAADSTPDDRGHRPWPSRSCRAVTAALCLGVLLASTGRAAVYPMPAEGDSVIGEVHQHVAAHEDTFVALARHYDVGFEELKLANPGVDPWLPGEGTEVTIPTRFVLPDAPRRGVVLNVPEMRLYYFPKPRDGEAPVVMTFPVSVGRQDWSTPYGVTSVVAKQRDPSWYPPKSIREEHAADGRPLPTVVPPGPDNPLGRHALRLGLPGYLIHGTNKPAGLGMRVTHGCVRMFPVDIETLYGYVGVGERVQIVNQPYKMGWLADRLYVEVHPPLEEDEVTQSRGLTALTELFVSRTDEEHSWQIDWVGMEALYRRGRGIAESLTVSAVPIAPAVEADPAVAIDSSPAMGAGAGEVASAGAVESGN